MQTTTGHAIEPGLLDLQANAETPAHKTPAHMINLARAPSMQWPVTQVGRQFQAAQADAVSALYNNEYIFIYYREPHAIRA